MRYKHKLATSQQGKVSIPFIRTSRNHYKNISKRKRKRITTKKHLYCQVKLMTFWRRLWGNVCDYHLSELLGAKKIRKNHMLIGIYTRSVVGSLNGRTYKIPRCCIYSSSISLFPTRQKISIEIKKDVHGGDESIGQNGLILLLSYTVLHCHLVRFDNP